MSAISASRSAPPGEEAPPPPLIAPTGNPSIDAVADVVNATAEPFQQLANPDLGTSQRVAAGLNAAMGVMGAVPDLVDTGFAVLTAPLAKLFPALPAITLLGMHVGPPHTHTHPPSLTPPAPAPVPLPSVGILLGAGAVTVLIGGLPAARCGDIGISVTCGSLAPPFEVFTGSSNVFIGGARAARMGDLTKHCNPTSGGKPGALDLIMNAAAATAGALEGNKGAIAQAAAETAVLGVKAIMGKDPGLPMLPGALVGPPVPNVLIGGFPCPALGDMAQGKLLAGLKKALPKGKKKAPDRKHGEPLDGSNAAQREANGLKCNGSHPIYLVTGENFDSYIDFAPGGLFEWRRHYTSARYTADGPLGFGWRHFYQRTLRRRLHRATFTDWDGLRTEFGRFEPGETRTRANGYVLERLAPGHFRVRYRGRPSLEFRGGEFDDELLLTRVVRDGATLDLSYDALGRLTTLDERSAGERHRFELELDERGRIRRLWQVEPPSEARSAFDDAVPDTWRVHTDPGGAQLDRALGPAPDQRILRAAYRYSASGDLQLARDCLEGQARYEYDAFHRLTKQTDARDYSYSYRYDAQGRCVRASGQDGLWWCRVQYFPEERFTRYTEGDNATWEYHYDGAGVVTTIVDPYGGKLRRRLDGRGRLVAEIDSGGREIRWLYDAAGAHIGREDRFGHRFLPERDQPKLPDPFARVLPSSSQGWLFAGAIEPSPGAWLGIDPTELDPLPVDLQILARGCFRSRKPDALEASSAIRTRIELDAMGRKLRERDATGQCREWRYDATGNLIATIDRDRRRSIQETISWNLTGARIDPLGNAVRYEYTKIEQITAITDPLGNTSRYDYDLKQRLNRVYRHGKIKEEYVYDAGDHFVEKRDGQGRLLFANTIHSNHLVARRLLASGGEHRFDYDGQARIVEASTDAHDVRMAYDPLGRRVADIRDGKGVEHTHVGVGATTTRVLGRFEHGVRKEQGVVVLTHGSGETTRIEYPSPGLVRRRCSNGTVEIQQFDEQGRLEGSLRYRTGHFGRAEGVAIRYAYSAEGDLLQVADSEHGTTLYEVDAAHRLVGERTPEGQEYRYCQDPAGNLTSTSHLDHIEFASGNRLQRTSEETFEYDERNRISVRTGSAGSYTRYYYDSFDMLVRVERAADLESACTVWTAEYDAIGRRLTTRWGDRQREFYWDGDRLAAEFLLDGRLRVYEYASHDALVPLSFTEYELSSPGRGRTFHVFASPVGMPLAIEDSIGARVWDVRRVDPYGRLEPAASANIECRLRWPGHYMDAETGLHYNRHRYYDPGLGRYLQSDPIGHEGSPINLYSYCANPLVAVDLLGTHGSRADGGASTPRPGSVPSGQDAAASPPPSPRIQRSDHLEQELFRRAFQALRDRVQNRQSAGPSPTAVFEAAIDLTTGRVVVRSSGAPVPDLNEGGSQGLWLPARQREEHPLGGCGMPNAVVDVRAHPSQGPVMATRGGFTHRSGEYYFQSTCRDCDAVSQSPENDIYLTGSRPPGVANLPPNQRSRFTPPADW